MKLRKIKTFLALSLALVLTVSAAACSTTTQPTSTSSTVSQSSAINSSNTSSEVSLNENKDFDFDAVCKDIEINGKKYTFPFSLDDLGNGYSFDNIRYLKADEETYTVYADIIYNNQKILSSSIDNLSKEYYKKDSKITSFPITYISQDCREGRGMKENTNYIKIANLKIGDTSNDVKNKLGEAHEIIYKKNGNLGSHTYYQNNTYCSKNLCYAFDNNGFVDYIGIIV